MKKRNKHLMIGVLSAALLFNGAVAFTPAAYADDDWSEGVVVKGPLDSQQLVSDWLRLLVVNTSGVANKDLSDVLDDLAFGKTLAQAAGLSEMSLASGLQQIANQKVAQALLTSVATEDQINSLNEEIRSKTLEAISTPGGYKASGSSSFNFEGLLQERLSSLNSAAAVLSEDDSIDVLDRLKEGSTLVQATRVNAAQLEESLKHPLYAQINQAEAQGVISSEQAFKYKEEAAQAIREGLGTPGGVTVTKPKDVTSSFDGSELLKKRAESIIEDISLFTPDYDANELTEAMGHGLKVLEATSLSREELIADLQVLWAKDIEEAYSNGQISDQVKEELLIQAHSDIQAAVSALN